MRLDRLRCCLLFAGASGAFVSPPDIIRGGYRVAAGIRPSPGRTPKTPGRACPCPGSRQDFARIRGGWGNIYQDDSKHKRSGWAWPLGLKKRDDTEDDNSKLRGGSVTRAAGQNNMFSGSPKLQVTFAEVI